MASPDGLRERKKRQTRQDLVAVAMRLFASRGYERVTMADIAEAAEVGTRTVFRYFGDKAELVFADDELVDDTLRQALRARPAGEEPWDATTVALTHLTTLWEGRRVEGRRRRTLIAGSPSLTARHLVKLQHHGDVISRELVDRGTSPVTAQVIGRTSVATFDCAVDQWLDDAHVRLKDALLRALEVLHAPSAS